jgi:sirohydrochlorin cobaltochelatase
MSKHAIVLVGHGGIPHDAPRRLVTELKRLEGERLAQGRSEAGARERELDRELRTWPRTRQTDPYRHGLETIAAALAPRLAPQPLYVAYNEFCAPSVEDIVDRLTQDGFTRVTLCTTMITPGGSHADGEIPALVTSLRARHPALAIDYAWPFDVEDVASFLSAHVRGHLQRNAS